GVECAGKTFLARDHNEQCRFLFPTQQQRMAGFAGNRIVNLSARHQGLENVGKHLGVRTRRQSPFLRPAQLGCRAHLHGLGDLPRVLHAADPAPDIEKVRHDSSYAFAAASCRSLTKRCLNSVRVRSMSAFKASSMFFFSMMVASILGFMDSTY